MLGGSYSGFTNAINSNGIKHILKEHGENGVVDHSMADVNDLARIAYVLDNYDTVNQATYASGDIKYSQEFRGKNNRPAPMLVFSKKVNGTYYVIEAVPDTQYKKFWVVSAYMEKKGGITQAPNEQGQGNTPEASLASLPPKTNVSEKSIAQNRKNSNGNSQTAVEQEYRTLVGNAIREGDYQHALKLFREYNNPALRAYKEFYTLKTFSEYAAAQGYIPATDTSLGTEEALAALEESYQKAIENAAKDGIIVAGTPTDHFDRKARFYGLEEDLAAVNPNYATKKYEWTHNCQRCVSTLEMRFRGFKVSAKPIPGKVENDDLAYTVELAWKNAERKWCMSDNGRAQVEDYMRRWGDGSRAIVGMTFPSDVGHVFFAIQIDGKTVFVDPQYPAADCEQYFNRYVKGWLYVIRVDNLQPSDRITDCCKSGDE